MTLTDVTVESVTDIVGEFVIPCDECAEHQVDQPADWWTRVQINCKRHGVHLDWYAFCTPHKEGLEQMASEQPQRLKILRIVPITELPDA